MRMVSVISGMLMLTSAVVFVGTTLMWKTEAEQLDRIHAVHSKQKVCHRTINRLTRESRQVLDKIVETYDLEKGVVSHLKEADRILSYVEDHLKPIKAEMPRHTSQEHR